MKHRFGAAIAACVLALSGAANAQQIAYTNKTVNLRAGPARTYPLVAVLPANMQVSVYGCLQGYTWCDVLAGVDRGWVYAGNLTYPYGGRDLLLPGIAAVLGIGIASFVFDDYWRDHYTERWWWPQRRRWAPAPMPPIRSREPRSPQLRSAPPALGPRVPNIGPRAPGLSPRGPGARAAPQGPGFSSPRSRGVGPGRHPGGGGPGAPAS